MQCKERRKKAGDVLTVRDSYHYPLPRGLALGTPLNLVAHDRGYWIVEANGGQYKVFQSLVDAGFEYELSGAGILLTIPASLRDLTKRA